MAKIRRPGPEDPLSGRATNGGEGYRARVASHAVEVSEGRLWTRCGVSSEVAPLRAVMLAVPGAELDFPDPPDRWLMLERVDVDAMRRETEAIAASMRAHGVHVILHRPATPPPPNFLFMRDLFLMTPAGAVVGRMGAEQRAGEERHAQLALASAGIPVVAAVHGSGTFEGADALWLDAKTVLVGVGRRTNREGYAQVRRVLASQGVEALAVTLPKGVQHLLGVVNLIDHDLAAVNAERLTRGIRGALERRGIRLIALEPSHETRWGRAMNFVTLRPRHVLMPAGAPEVRATLVRAGVVCEEVGVDQYLRAAGGLGCLTGVLHRGA